jgi:2-desacetyl-2-hydroxyethyl bacteriochlorophyllide A dehydrogenase
MRAVRPKEGKPAIVDVPEPVPAKGEALIQVILAGICATDLEILRGYMSFEGTLGHEFVGRVVQSPDASLEGKRVVGGINCGCGTCEYCTRGLSRHCPSRTVLGIAGRDGAFAEKLTLPVENLVRLPDHVGDREAVFAEPIAAALEIAEQVDIPAGLPVLIMGDGRLGTLTAMVLRAAGADITVSGRVPGKMALLKELGFALLAQGNTRRFPVVVDATGSADALGDAIRRTEPRGTLVLKTTTHRAPEVNLSQVVVDEITIVGSRCGRMEEAVSLIGSDGLSLERLITGTYDLADAAEAFRIASLPASLKVLLKP